MQQTHVVVAVQPMHVVVAVPPTLAVHNALDAVAVAAV